MGFLFSVFWPKTVFQFSEAHIKRKLGTLFVPSSYAINSLNEYVEILFVEADTAYCASGAGGLI